MSDIVLALIIVVVFVVVGVTIWYTPDYDSLPKSDDEKNDPWPDEH